MARLPGDIRTITDASIPGLVGKGLVFLVPLMVAAVAMQLSDLVPIDGALGWVVLGIGALAMVALMAINNERTWVFTAVICHAFMLSGSTEDSIGIGEIGYSIIVLGGMGIWFVKEWTTGRRLIVTGFDILLASFVVLSTGVTLLATLLNNGDMVSYVKEWGILADILFYFPLRRVLNRREDVILLLTLFVVVAIANGIVAGATYRERLAQAVYQWQLKARSNINEPTSMALLVLSSGLVAYAERWWLRILGFAGVSVGLVLLLITYSRNPIFSGVLGALIMAALIPWRHGRRVVLALLLAAVVGTASAFILYPRFATIITSALGSRLASVAKASTDLSLKSRIVESETLFYDHILKSPLIGYGYGIPFGFHSPITKTWNITTYVHNGYFWAVFKFGFPIALLLMATVLYPMGRLLFRAPPRHSGFNRVLMAGMLGYCLSSLVMNMTSNLFTGVSAMMNFALCWSLFDYLHRTEADAPVAEAPVLPSGNPNDINSRI